MNESYFRTKQLQWALFQVTLPILIILLELYIRFKVGENYSWMDFFTTQKLTLIAFVIFLNMAFVVLLESNKSKVRNKSSVRSLTLNMILTYIFIAFTIFGGYIVLLIEGLALEENSHFSYLVSSLGIYVMLIGLAVRLQLRYANKILSQI